MKKNILIFAVFLISNIIFSQTVKKEEINGTWKVEKNLTKISNPNFKDLIEGFQSSTFRFDQNGNFELYSSNKSKIFSVTLEATKNKKWKFDNDRQLIKIGSTKNYFSTMGINVKKLGNQMIFQISESPLEFVMSRIK